MNEQSPFVILKPGNYPSRDKIYITDNLEEFVLFIRDIPEQELVAVDFETNGQPIYTKEFKVVGLSLAGTLGSMYIDLSKQPEEEIKELLLFINSRLKLFAHNVMYDGSVWKKISGEHGAWEYCTYGLFRHFATEGFWDQRWGLKYAMTELLGWPSSNTTDLDAWLCANGHIKGNRIGNPDYSKMYLAPTHVIGKYGALDSEATWLLFNHIFKPVLDKFPSHVKEYNNKYFITLVKILIDQYLLGIKIDREGLAEYREKLIPQIELARQDCLNHPDLLPIVTKYYEQELQNLMDLEPERYLKSKLGKEPPKTKKDGTPSKNWEKWFIKSQQPPIESELWKRWEKKVDKLKATNINVFNINSNKQVQWALYENLHSYVVIKEPVPEQAILGAIQVTLNTGEQIDLDMTDSGGLPTDGNALIQMGGVGLLIDKYKELLKLLNFVDNTLSYSEVDGRVHPEFKVPGTLTGRLAGGGDGHSDKRLSIHQLPKVREYLQYWVADPGTAWVQADFTALEQVVLAELSKDKSLWEIYGPDAKAQDIYLFTGAQLPVIGKPILKSGYDPFNPTKEGIAAAKKEAKKERGIAKVIVLSSSYGAGPHKIYKTLRAQKIDITLDEVRGIHKNYWDLYKGVKDFERDLEREWNSNKGWFLNGLGLPIGVYYKKKKDMVNRCIQSTGHSCLVITICLLKEELDKEGIKWQPIIADLHDEFIIQCAAIDKDKVQSIVMNRVIPKLNSILGGEIPLKMEPSITDNLADIKCTE